MCAVIKVGEIAIISSMLIIIFRGNALVLNTLYRRSIRTWVENSFFTGATQKPFVKYFKSSVELLLFILLSRGEFVGTHNYSLSFTTGGPFQVAFPSGYQLKYFKLFRFLAGDEVILVLGHIRREEKYFSELHNNPANTLFAPFRNNLVSLLRSVRKRTQILFFFTSNLDRCIQVVYINSF